MINPTSRRSGPRWVSTTAAGTLPTSRSCAAATAARSITDRIRPRPGGRRQRPFRPRLPSPAPHSTGRSATRPSAKPRPPRHDAGRGARSGARLLHEGAGHGSQRDGRRDRPREDPAVAHQPARPRSREQHRGSHRQRPGARCAAADPAPPRTRGRHRVRDRVPGTGGNAAAQAAVLRGIPAIVREISEVQALEMQVVENLQRADLHPLDEAAAYGELITHHKYDVARIAAHIGRSVAYVYDRVKLLKLVKDLRQHFLEGRFTPGHAVLLARLSPKDQARVLQQALYQSEASLFDGRGRRGRDERTRRSFKPCSVRELQAWIDRHVRFDAREPDPMLFPETATTLEAAAENREKIIPITKASFIPGRRARAARGSRPPGGAPTSASRSRASTRSRVSWQSVPAAARPSRSASRRKCQVHWAKEIREKRARAAAAEARRPPGVKGGGRRPPCHLEGAAGARSPASRAVEEGAAGCAPGGRRGREQGRHAALERARPTPDPQGQWLHGHRPGARRGFAPGNDAETTVRHAALILLWRDLENYHGFGGDLRAVKALGVDPAKILKAQREAEKKAEGRSCAGRVRRPARARPAGRSRLTDERPQRIRSGSRARGSR